MKFCLLILVSLGVYTAQAQIIAGDFADPSIIKSANNYYAVGTSSEWAPHFPVYTSTDLQNWKQAGYVFDKTPEWTSGSFWAPEYYFHNNTYYIYYTARRKADGISCVGVATSKYPDKGFKDHGVLIDFGKEAIDGFVYNDNGQLYITFKAYGLDKRPIEILGSKLSADGLKLEGEVFSMLKDDSKQGMEGQSILKQGEYYYLFYSAGGCCGSGCSYNVRVARSKSFQGPYEDHAQNPILKTNDLWKCPGHGSFVKQDENKYLYMYHAYNRRSDVFTGREGMLAELTFSTDNAWPAFVPQKASKATPADLAAFPAYWQWDFRNTKPVVRNKNGQLYVSGKGKTGVALTVRPVSNRFDVTSTVINSNGALKGLVFYGDANAAVGVGVRNDSIEFWMVKDDQRTALAAKKILPNLPVKLQFTMNADLTGEVFFTQNNTTWQQLGSPVDIRFLPQWDRSPRIGLHFQGKPNEEAVFSGFSLVNK